MIKNKIVRLKPGKDKPVLNRHHWIFSGAIGQLPSFEAGELLKVESSSGELLGTAYFNKNSSISGRMVSFGEQDPYQAIKESIHEAIQLRKTFFDNQTTAYRLINAEGDCLPGLIVDYYDGVLVLQITTLGMSKLKSLIINDLTEEMRPIAIFEKPSSYTRKEEHLTDKPHLIFGKIPKPLVIKENGILFDVDVEEGQKTGFFLDQREMRKLVKEISLDKKVLNTFCYTGGFSLYALSGGAKKVTSVDISKTAIEQAEKNILLNGFIPSKEDLITADVFQFLREQPLDYDLIILDPPAFAKQAKDTIAACRGYKDINRIALQKMPKNSILITCSCSHFVDEKLFQQVIFQAAAEAKRNVKILSTHRQAFDHPINVFHPEGAYLKSLVLYII